jgi:hypothetical protein
LGYIGPLGSHDAGSFQLVDKQSKDVVDTAIKTSWAQVLQQARQSQPILAELMQSVEKLPTSARGRFQKVTAQFAKLNAVSYLQENSL